MNGHIRHCVVLNLSFTFLIASFSCSGNTFTGGKQGEAEAISTLPLSTTSTLPPVSIEQMSDVKINLQRKADKAAWNNCLLLSINDGPQINAGCNKTGGINKTTVLTVKSKPSCNKIRFILNSNNKLNFSTANKKNIRVESNATENLANFRGFKMYRQSEDALLVLTNDNGDRENHSDTTFVMSGLSQVNYYIENAEANCL